MKQECLFEIKNNSLFLKSTNEEIVFSSSDKIDFSLEVSSQNIALPKNSVTQIGVKMTAVSLGEGNFDENFLAELRLFFKKIEDSGSWAVVLPINDGNFEANSLIETVAHTARRIKDCKSVVGIAVPPQFADAETTALVDSLKKKHPHYIYFSGNGKIFMA